VESRRRLLALLYALATMLAPGLHDHTGGSAEAHHEASCDDQCPHFTGHWSPDLSHVQDDCLACQYRSQHHACQLSPPLFHRLSQAGPVETPLPACLARSLHRISCRAPPRA
jgi:hypothetical protein